MNTYNVGCTIGTTDPAAAIGIEIWLDSTVLYQNTHVTESAVLTFDVTEDEAEHELRFVMTGKAAGHTQLDSNGAILADACLTIRDVSFDDITLNQLFVNHAVYTHDFNGTKDTIDEKFYGVMGCNGKVTLKFTTPIYLWLLEHM